MFAPDTKREDFYMQIFTALLWVAVFTLFLHFRTLVDDAISQYSAALQSNLIPETEDPLSKKAILLIQALLVRALHHQEITKGTVHFDCISFLYSCLL